MRFVVVAIVLCSTLAAGFGYTYSQEGKASEFLTAPVERGSIATVVKASGAIEAVVTVDVSSQLSGRIADVFVSFNDAVKAGQPIAQIDPEIFAARVKRGAGSAQRRKGECTCAEGGVGTGKDRGAQCAHRKKTCSGAIGGNQGQARGSGKRLAAKVHPGTHGKCKRA